jgi:hypothetical protein
MTNPKMTVDKKMKDLLSDPKNRIKLDDYVTTHIKAFLTATNVERFSAQHVEIQKEDFLKLIQEYEDIIKDLQQIVILLTRWARREELSLLEKVFCRLSEVDNMPNLGWYPIQILMYSAGITALFAQKYDALKVVLTTPIQKSAGEKENLPVVVLVASSLSDIDRAFKWVPGHERNHVPRSEHLFKILEPVLENVLFIGKRYEKLFDDFEVYYSLVCADVIEHHWGPIGRFGYKHQRRRDNPLNRVVEEAKVKGERWLPLQVGVFGSLERFLEIAGIIGQRVRELCW